MKDFSNQFNKIMVEAYHNLLLMEETKRKYSSGRFSFRDRNAIAFLMRNPGETKISDLADYLKISRPSATTLVKKLEKYGLLQRVPKPGDSKVTLLKLTGKGKRYSSYHKRYTDRLTEGLDKEFTDEEKEILYRGFCRLNDFFIESINESNEKHKQGD